MSGTMTRKLSTATSALAPTKTSAPSKEPVACTMAPMTMGVVIDEMLPNMLNRPPDRPAISRGAVSDSTAQPSAPTPLPKKDSAISATTSHCAST